MSRQPAISIESVIQAVKRAGPGGLAPEALAGAFPDISRSTLNRRLRELTLSGQIRPVGQGRATRYIVPMAYSTDDIRRYFATDWQARVPARYREELLEPDPGLEADKAMRLAHLQALSRPLDRKFLADFLIDFSWASSVLEGSTYSDIDTQALLEYGQRNPDKPVEDAVLALNHKNAIQHLWANRELASDNLCRIQSLLTDRHGLAEIIESEHFLPEAQRGHPREYAEVHLGRSTYSPPFRPGTGYIAGALERIVVTARDLEPVSAAFYLMTRIPYLQAFANGNKRTSRLAANLPLLQANLLPISFVDFNKADYIMGMAAFYELGDTQLIAQTFIEGYARSIVRGSDIPTSVRVAGFNIEKTTRELVHYVHTARIPDQDDARRFLNHAVSPAPTFVAR
ncbi:MAG: Fic family protein [Rhodocyclaceae bacterium]